jgi:hypothetical protein
VGTRKESLSRLDVSTGREVEEAVDDRDFPGEEWLEVDGAEGKMPGKRFEPVGLELLGDDDSRGSDCIDRGQELQDPSLLRVLR